MIKRIFLDLDGVIRAWDEAVIELYDLPLTQRDIKDWGYVYTIYKKMYPDRPTEKDFWDGMNQYFWEGLDFTKEAQCVLELLKETNREIILLTSPTMNNAGWSQTWIRNHMPEYFYQQKYIIGPCKYVCANEHSLLIDDAEKNIDPWREKGGVGFLFPRPWNRMRKYASAPVAELKDHLIGLKLINI